MITIGEQAHLDTYFDQVIREFNSMTKDFDLDLSHLPLKKPSQVDEPELIALYGPPGGGKTYMAATASELDRLAPVLILDTEGSAAGTLAHFEDERVDILSVGNFGDLDQLIDALTERTHKYKTVIIDTFDVAQAWAVDYFLAENPSNTFAGWGDVKAWTVEVARRFKAAPFLGVLVFHEDKDKTDTGAMHSGLVLQGGAKAVLPGVPDVVALITRKADKEGVETTTATFAPDTRRATKNRFALPAQMENPSIPAIFEHIAERRKNKAAPKVEEVVEEKKPAEKKAVEPKKATRTVKRAKKG